MGILDYINSPGFNQIASGLKDLGAMDTARRDQEHMQKVFAANPAFAQALYGTMNQQAQTDIARQSALAKMAELNQPKYEQVGNALLKILPNGGGFEKVYEGAGGANVPSSIQEYEYYSKLTPEQKREYLTAKRSQQVLDIGSGYNILLPSGQTAPLVEKQLPPEKTPENIRQAEAAKVGGAAAGQAAVDLPNFENSVTAMKQKIDDLINSEGFSAVVGVKNPLKGAMPFLEDAEGYPSVTSGSPAADSLARLKEIKGGQFMQAFQSLKGGGQITEQEGAKATAAISRMMATQSEEGFRQAAEDFKAEMDRLLEIVRKKAGGGAVTAAPATQGITKEQALEMLKQRGRIK